MDQMKKGLEILKNIHEWWQAGNAPITSSSLVGEIPIKEEIALFLKEMKDLENENRV